MLDRCQIDLVLQAALAVPLRYDLAMDAQPGHAAVRIDVEFDMRKCIRIIDRETVFEISLELRLRKNLDPVAQRVMRRLRRRETGLDRAMRWKVAGVDDHAAHNAWKAETDDGEVVPGHALAAALPSVHPFPALGVFVLLPHRLLRLEQILFWSEEVVRGIQHGAAEALGSEVDEFSKISCHPERSEGPGRLGGASCRPTTPAPRYARGDISAKSI